MAKLVSSFLFVLVLSSMLQITLSRTAPTPSPNVDCTGLVMKMADCLSYVSSGSGVTKPQGRCCNGLKTVLKTDAACLCEAFKSSASLGVHLNVTKALTLPSLCGVKSPPLDDCGLSNSTASPSAAPVNPPEVSSPSHAPVPATVPPSPFQVPSPAPVPATSKPTSGASAVSVSASLGLIAAFWALFLSVEVSHRSLIHNGY